MKATWIDPPGFLYASAYVIAVACFTIFIQKSPLKRKKRIPCLFLMVILPAFMVVTNGVEQGVFLLCAALEFGMLYGMVYFANDLDAVSAMYYACHLFIIGEFCASLEWLLCYFITGGGGTVQPAPIQMFSLVIIYILVFAAIFGIGKKVYNMQTDVTITRREMGTTFLISLVIYSISNLSYVPVNTPFSAQLPREIFNIHTWVDLGGLAILFAYHAQLMELQMKVDFDNMQNILDMQYANYQISQKSVDMVNRKYHDLKHQIMILREEFGSKDALQYLDKMQSEIEAYEAQNKTGNKVLDTILTGKSLYCQQNDIKLTVVADGSLLNFMDIMDISSLFGNALDNAIESVGAIQDKEKRLIHLTITRKKCFVRIRIENCYGGELDFQNGLPQTTKKNRNYHGYGLKSIKGTVQKYNGSVTIEAKDGWFELRILIPIGVGQEK